jgi:hypothetical protein
MRKYLDVTDMVVTGPPYVYVGLLTTISSTPNYLRAIDMLLKNP